jgi:hypothetical protein
MAFIENRVGFVWPSLKKSRLCMAFIENKVGLNMALPENNRWLFVLHRFTHTYTHTKTRYESSVLNKYLLFTFETCGVFS